MRLMTAAILLTLCLSMVWAGKVNAEKRAFVIGIDRYDNLDQKFQLRRAVNDARAVAKEFSELGFQVMMETDVARHQFNGLWQSFLDSINTGDTVTVYFSGHGMEIDGQTYLLPRSIPHARWGRESQLRRESVSLPELLYDVREKGPSVSVFIIDACREHPLDKGGTRAVISKGGLTPKLPPQGTFIMYSAGDGQLALDRLPSGDPDKVNSVYTRVLLSILRQKGLPLPEAAREIRNRVWKIAQSVGHPQSPAYYDNLLGTFCFAGCDGAPSAAPTAIDVPANSKETEVAANVRAVAPPDAHTCDVISPPATGARKIREGALFCGASKTDTTLVRRVLPYRVIFSINGKDMSCNSGELCSFPWSVDAAPYFRIQRISQGPTSEWQLVLVDP